MGKKIITDTGVPKQKNPSETEQGLGQIQDFGGWGSSHLISYFFIIIIIFFVVLSIATKQPSLSAFRLLPLWEV